MAIVTGFRINTRQKMNRSMPLDPSVIMVYKNADEATVLHSTTPSSTCSSPVSCTIPATIQPAILIVIVLIAVQAVINLIADWNLEPEVHTGTAEADEEEIEAIKKSIGAK